MTKVLIPNRTPGHDYTDAARYGDLVFMTDGPVARAAVRRHKEAMRRHIASSEPEDMIVVGSLSVLTAVAASLMAARHHKLNLLLWERGRYIPAHITMVVT